MKLLLKLKPVYKKAYLFLIVGFLAATITNVMGYVSPIFLDNLFPNKIVVGLFISLNSVVGIVFDILVGASLSNRHYRFFYRAALMMAVVMLLFFPINTPLSLAILMSVWGIQYVFMWAANQSYIAQEFTPQQIGRLTAFYLVICTISGLIVPVLITPSLEQNNIFFSFILLAFCIVAIALIIRFRNNVAPHTETFSTTGRLKRISIITELKIWKVLFSKVGFYVAFMILFNIFDSFFWTLGPIFAYHSSAVSPIADLFLSVYMLPGLFIGLYTPFIEKIFTKEASPFITMGIAGLGMLVFLFTKDVGIIILTTFIASLISSPGYATAEGLLNDYTRRLKDDENYLLGLRGFANDLGYVIGPTLAGIFAENLGIENSFGFIGIVMVIFAVVAYIGHNTVRIPIQEINLLEKAQKS